MNKKRVEFGDFQTPSSLAERVCLKLKTLGIKPNSIIEPTCGKGAFLIAAETHFFECEKFTGNEINLDYLEEFKKYINSRKIQEKFTIINSDFFKCDWPSIFDQQKGRILILGNPPWVTNSVLGELKSDNLPLKSNFQKLSGFDAISGKSNFDISEWMIIEILKSLKNKEADIAMLVKTAVARKIINYLQKNQLNISHTSISKIDAKRDFNASVDACLLIISTSELATPNYDYYIYDSLEAQKGTRVGFRLGLPVSKLDDFEEYRHLIGKSPVKWRSGVKHDASSVMEFDLKGNELRNGFNEIVDIEDSLLFPLMKGSDLSKNNFWRSKYVLITQKEVGDDTTVIKTLAPLTWGYLVKNAKKLDQRGSSIYKKNPRFSIFGIGDYAFTPWKIAICSLYKNLDFKIIGPINGKPVMFDDTVYYVSFNSEQVAKKALKALQSKQAQTLLNSLIFWDDKRPIKTSILNYINWDDIEEL